MRRPVLVCIAGGSASGKSTVARALVERLADHGCAIVNTDNYFRDWTVDDEIRTANRPDAVLWTSLVRDLDRLLAGDQVRMPAEGTRAAARGMDPWTLHAADLIVCEGLLTLWSDELRARCDLAVFVDVHDDERLMRRITRDIRERGATVDSAIAWYRHDVAPSFRRFTEPSRWRADLVVPNVGSGGPSEASLAALTAAVRSLIETRDLSEQPSP